MHEVAAATGQHHFSKSYIILLSNRIRDLYIRSHASTLVETTTYGALEE
jgi:hypothetical protein